MARRRPVALRIAKLFCLALSTLWMGCYCGRYATQGCLEVSQIHASQEPRLRQHLHDKRSWVREEAARALGALRSVDAATELEATAQATRERPWVRAAAVEALGKIGAPGSRAVLVGLAQAVGDPPEVRLALVGALCGYATDSEAWAALESLTQDPALLVAASASHRVNQRCGS